jgi:hypothetical protein
MDGKDCSAVVYDRARLKAGNRIAGPAIVVEMDSTTVILPRHHGTVDTHGNILIYPDGYRPRRAAKTVARTRVKVARKAKSTGRK